jgi:hypothetical protein
VNNIKPIPDMKIHSLKTTHAFRLVVNSTVEPMTQTANYTKRDYELSDIFSIEQPHPKNRNLYTKSVRFEQILSNLPFNEKHLYSVIFSEKNDYKGDPILKWRPEGYVGLRQKSLTVQDFLYSGTYLKNPQCLFQYEVKNPKSSWRLGCSNSYHWFVNRHETNDEPKHIFGVLKSVFETVQEIVIDLGVKWIDEI